MRRFALLMMLLTVCLAVCCWLLCGPHVEGPTQEDERPTQSKAADRDLAPSATSGRASPNDAQEEEPSAEQQQGDLSAEQQGLLESPADIVLVPSDDTGYNYTFAYGSREFLAYYEPDVWKVYDSYLITNHRDIMMICQALLDEHPICGSDYQTVRTAEDMAFEWEQHNIACELLPPDSPWQESVRNVDLDPEDQNKTMREMLDSRTGGTSAKDETSEPDAATLAVWAGSL